MVVKEETFTVMGLMTQVKRHPMLLSTTPDGTTWGSPYTANIAYQVNNAFVDQASYIASLSFPFGKALLTVTQKPRHYIIIARTIRYGGSITKI